MKNEKQLKRFENYYRFLKWERIEYQLFKGLYFRAIAISISINEDHVAKIYSPIFELEAFLNTIEKFTRSYWGWNELIHVQFSPTVSEKEYVCSIC